MNHSKHKIVGMLFCFLFITTPFIPVVADYPIPSSTSPPINDTTFDRKISFFMHVLGYPSLATCIIQNDHMVWSKGYGYYDRSNHKPTTVDTAYLLASITKTIVGTALMQLYEQHFFDLDDDVNTYLPFSLRNPNFPDDPITICMLLSHTSSLNTNDQNQYYWSNFSDDPPFEFFPEPYLREFLLPGGKYYDPSIWSSTYRPGEYAMYSNIGFDILSYLVEIISGESFLSYCDTHIFSPLDMKNTSFNLSHLSLDQVAIPYIRFMGRYYRINELAFMWGEDWTPLDPYWRIRCYPAGGLYSTVSDLSHFLIAHMNGGVYNGSRILEKETVQLMHEIQPGNQIGYGLAWMHHTVLGILTSGHSGGYPGVNTWMLYNESEGTGVIFLANGSPGYVLPFGGRYLMMTILYLLFMKEGTLQLEPSSEYNVSSEPFFMMPLVTHRVP